MSGGPVLVLIEHDRGVPAETAFQALGLARDLADQLGADLAARIANLDDGGP